MSGERSTLLLGHANVVDFDVQPSSDGSSTKSKCVFAASVVATCMGVLLTMSDVVIPSLATTSLFAQTSTATPRVQPLRASHIPEGENLKQAVVTGAAATVLGLSSAVEPVQAQPGLLEELGVQYKSAAVTAVKPKEAESQAPRKKVAASTDALAELKKGILADAPELTEKAVPKKEGPKAPQAPEATKAPAKKEELKLKKVYTAPAPAPRPPPVQTTPKYGQGKVLPKVEEAVPVKVVEPLAKPVAARDIRKSPTKARPASKVVEPEPVKEAPKAKDEGVGFFGLKPAPKKEVVVPEVQPSKVVRKLPKETKGKGEKLAEKKAAPVPVKEAPKAEKKAEKKGSSKKESGKKEQKKEEKKKGGNPLLGPLLLLGGIYGLGVYTDKEEKKEGSEESVATEAPKAPEPKPEPAPEPTVAKEEEGESQV
jgi:hypothetical protein|uniref:Uncharacterized protein n=1 Tax=Eutreptiella gymnastica TaxID=73025 RepID=A0A7S4G2W3_9EUGL|mmetsp:Transcript_9300/g.17453  ORF Transcript_9300/g.17453 Transcript_9300/m.17453 type:complete len:426 (+) Transcript_9300:29-1306(+)|eukprot:CAMPEP_0174287328 /NCGR_PEP_ID=MMETSP0809-20121228/15474_1 /TAXON_ID=73025 ORGANISM="Eutreptiella gymnastica-like, Strain CCMP1594" /NCGR_SAMPLE_ID=MMETSP0809 /ASSEMBLY_ACC=CAM_ASM_000658 /LENGTH=425 /DNA_ID=CAMNT_0015383845 /DNA_START=29 /DNA_END=1306 /DNA_ORIENTATION=+